MKTALRNLLLAILFFTISLAYAESNIYEDIDSKTAALIKKSDDLIQKRQYDSAFNILGKDLSNKFIIHKKTEICINYFVQSIGHRMFALHDLKENEDLYELRSGTGSFNMYLYDPVEIIAEYYKKNQQDAIIEKTLGDYYYDVGLRYQGNWFETDEIITKKCIEHYENAFAKKFYTVNMLINCADRYIQLKNADKAIEYYSKALDENPSLYNVPFNLSSAYYEKGNYKAAILYGNKAIEIYKNDPNYQMDAILLCSDASYAQNDFNKSIEYLNMGLSISKEEYRIYKNMVLSYLALNNIQKANENADNLFSLAPGNPAASQMIMELYGKNAKELVTFFARNIKKYANDDTTLANLYFHIAVTYYHSNNKKEALNYALLAKEKFIKVNTYNANKQTIDELIAKCQ
jgi:tetratricopeptide (TPR) repeat protein